MAIYQLVISPAAKNDLKEIYQYGLRQWGEIQSDNYLLAIKERFWLLTTQPQMGVERQEFQPHVRSLPMMSHVMFYRINDNTIEIIRVLHGRQDPFR